MAHTDHVVRVHVEATGTAPDQWYAHCAEHNWFGPYRSSKGAAHADAGDHCLAYASKAIQ